MRHRDLFRMLRDDRWPSESAVVPGAVPRWGGSGDRLLKPLRPPPLPDYYTIVSGQAALVSKPRFPPPAYAHGAAKGVRLANEIVAASGRLRLPRLRAAYWLSIPCYGNEG